MKTRSSNSITILLLTVLSLTLAATGGYAQENTAAAVTQWLDSSEFKALADDPALAFKQVSPADVRAADIARFPESITDNRVTDANEVAKLRLRLAPLFDYAKDAAALELIIIRDEAPLVLLAEKSALIFSTGALSLLPDRELRAVAAHELAHIYFFNDLLEMALSKKFEGLRLLELKCDVIGMLIIERAGGCLQDLICALRRIYDYEKSHNQDADRASIYPTLPEREAVARQVRAFLNNRQRRTQT